MELDEIPWNWKCKEFLVEIVCKFDLWSVWWSFGWSDRRIESRGLTIVYEMSDWLCKISNLRRGWTCLDLPKDQQWRFKTATSPRKSWGYFLRGNYPIEFSKYCSCLAVTRKSDEDWKSHNRQINDNLFCRFDLVSINRYRVCKFRTLHDFILTAPDLRETKVDFLAKIRKISVFRCSYQCFGQGRAQLPLFISFRISSKSTVSNLARRHQWWGNVVRRHHLHLVK